MSDAMVCKRCGHDHFHEDGTARYSRSGAVESHGKRKHYTCGAHNWTCSECDCIDYAPAAYGAVAA